jgi:hypothetical protein
MSSSTGSGAGPLGKIDGTMPEWQERVEANPVAWAGHSRSVRCAIAAAILFGALSALFGPWGLPALTLPFCFGTLVLTIMKYTSDKLVPVEPADITPQARPVT